MNLIDDWKAVATKAWSMRLALIATILSALEVAIPYMDWMFSRGTFAALAGIVSLAAGIARLVDQPDMRK
jgi:hypothetical protein